MAPRARLELATLRLTAECSTIELPGSSTTGWLAAVYASGPVPAIVQRKNPRTRANFALCAAHPSVHRWPACGFLYNSASVGSEIAQLKELDAILLGLAQQDSAPSRAGSPWEIASVNRLEGAGPLKKIRALGATGNLSSGFREETLVHAVQQGAHFIGCDAGTTDSGPYYLGSGNPRGPRDGTKRNLRIMIREGLKAGIP